MSQNHRHPKRHSTANRRNNAIHALILAEIADRQERADLAQVKWALFLHKRKQRIGWRITT